MRVSDLIYIHSTTGGDEQCSSKTIVRNRMASIQHRQQRLKNYGVSTAHGDGQRLLPISSNNQPAAHQHINNSQQYSSTSEIQSRHVPPSISTSITSISTSTAMNIVNNSSHQGMRAINLVASSKPRAMR